MNVIPIRRPLTGIVIAGLVAVTSVVALQTARTDAAGTIDNEFEGTGVVAAGSTTTLRVAGRGGVPANASAVSINLTVTNPASTGHATVYPCGETRPNASNLNFTAGSTAGNAVLAKVGTGGNICIYTNVRTNLIADVNGAFTTDAFTALNPARLIDTRPRAVAAGSTTTLRVAGRGGVPANASAVSINLTVTNPASTGHATVYPCGETRPNASNLNFTAGSTAGNAVLAKVGTGGNICIYTNVRTNLIADVNGAFTTDAFTALNPARLIDTRPRAVAAGSTTTLRVAGRGGVPANASAVSINLTVTNPASTGHATVYPCGETRPNASNLNFTAGSTAGNAVLAKVGTGGNICIYTNVRTNLIADVNGAFTTDAFTALNPARLIDTRPAPAAPAAHGSTGLSVDESAIPAPATGFSRARIGAASYEPQSGDGAFRTNCRISHMNFDDPIVFPGQRAATHLHAFFGKTGVDAYSNTSSIAGSGNSTCSGGTSNRSAYWSPGVVDVNTMRPVIPVGEHALQAYYKVGYQGVAPSQIQNMPAGLRMVAGDARSTRPQVRQGEGQPLPVVYYCVLGASGATTPEQTSFPNCAPGQTFVMKIVFPQCWDGVNLDSADHKSHMSYGTWGPTQGQNGAGCPRSHPVAIPEITQNFRYLVPQGGMTSWRLASDTYSGPAGYSGHADWWNGWDRAVFQRVVDNCLRQNIDCQMNLLGDGQALN